MISTGLFWVASCLVISIWGSGCYSWHVHRPNVLNKVAIRPSLHSHRSLNLCFDDRYASGYPFRQFRRDQTRRFELHSRVGGTNLDGAESADEVRSVSHQQSKLAPKSNGHLIQKTVALLTLTLQTSLLSLTMRWSHTRPKLLARSASSAVQTIVPYIPSTAVVCSEILKLAVCILAYFATRRRNDDDIADAPVERMQDLSPQDLLDLAIPSGLYVIQNNLQYLAMKNLPAAVYQVLAQMKLIVTAFLLSVVNKQPLSLWKWTSIGLLTAGVSLVQVALSWSKQTTSSVANLINFPVGVTAVAISCLTSAYAGVRMEQTFKRRTDDFWGKNLQFACISLLMSLVYALKDAPAVVRRGFFVGYHPMVWAVISIQALGGILVSLVVTQTNSVVKGFATSGAILLTALLSALPWFSTSSTLPVRAAPRSLSTWLLQSSPGDRLFTVGALAVCLATVMYSMPPKPPASTTASSPSPDTRLMP